MNASFRTQDMTCTFSKKCQLSDTVYQITFDMPYEVKFLPGQFVSLKVSDKDRRSYSIVSTVGQELQLLVDTRFGGVGSQFFNNLEHGQSVDVLLPLGSFTYKSNEEDKFFISTGTGVAPFIPMLEAMQEEGFKGKATLLYGSKTKGSLYLDDLLSPFRGLDLKVIYCISGEEIEEDDSFKNGRVADALKDFQLSLEKSDVYICGGPDMVQDTVDKLISQGIDSAKLYYEKY